MLERFRRSIELVKASIGVLRADKELLVFPAVSFVVMIIVTLTFALPLLLTGTFERVSEGAVGALDVVVAALFYVVSYTVIFFFNTALVGAALIRLDGGDPTLRDGFRIAWSRLPAIVGYALIAATVGMVLRWISERGGIIGQIVVGFVGLAWNIATFLVVPVLVVEKVGPIEAIKRSSSLLRKTWGEQIAGNIGISLVFGLLALAVILAGALLVALLISAAPLLAVGVVVLLVIVVLGIGLIAAAVSGIFTASVYRYATKGDGGTMFDSQTLAATFRSKNSR